MKFAIDFECLLQNLRQPSDLSTGILNYEFYDRLKTLKDEHEITLRVNMTGFSFSDLICFLDLHAMESWFESVEVVTNPGNYLVSDRTITTEQFMEISKNTLDTDSFQECVSWSQSQFT